MYDFRYNYVPAYLMESLIKIVNYYCRLLHLNNSSLQFLTIPIKKKIQRAAGQKAN